MPRLGVLDGLRGIAVLLVLWYHVWEISWLATPPWLAFLPATGFIGVHLFFFLSGFVISYPFIRARLRETPPPTWGQFAWRRFIKIVPVVRPLDRRRRTRSATRKCSPTRPRSRTS